MSLVLLSCEPQVEDTSLYESWIGNDGLVVAVVAAVVVVVDDLEDLG